MKEGKQEVKFEDSEKSLLLSQIEKKLRPLVSTKTFSQVSPRALSEIDELQIFLQYRYTKVVSALEKADYGNLDRQTILNLPPSIDIHEKNIKLINFFCQCNITVDRFLEILHIACSDKDREAPAG